MLKGTLYEVLGRPGLSRPHSSMFSDVQTKATETQANRTSGDINHIELCRALSRASILRNWTSLVPVLFPLSLDESLGVASPFLRAARGG